jgi:hypothetical protein
MFTNVVVVGTDVITAALSFVSPFKIREVVL